MTLTQVSSTNIRGITIQCMCGAALYVGVGERIRCGCGKEYYCDFSLHVWENVIRVAPAL